MKVTPLASDSMGVRSAATLVEAGEHRIIIDPSAAVAPRRFDLGPSEQETAALKRYKELINAEAAKSDVLILSHYHHDHFDPDADIYRGKDIYVKSWTAEINHSQRQRAEGLQERFRRQGVLERVKLCDGTGMVYDDGLELSFSRAVPHGPVGTEIGYVIMTTITDGDYKFMHCSDVQGPVEASTAQLIIGRSPDLVYIDGPPTHLLGTHFSHADLDKAINNILDIITYTGAGLILDHHLLRDLHYRELMGSVYDHGSRVQSAAEFIGAKNALMEASREILWKNAGDPDG